MKIYRKGGRIAVILKLRLPRATGEQNDGSSFNSFYSQAADKYVAVSGNAPIASACGSRPTTVSIDYAVVTDSYFERHPNKLKKQKNIVVIKRDVRINLCGEIRSREYYDLYDVDEQIFVN